jgi:hypothetical protein
MSEPIHIANLYLVGGNSTVSGNMASNITSNIANINEAAGYALQAVMTGSPVGMINVYASNDGTDFTLIPAFTAAVSGAGSYMVNYDWPRYGFVQLIYTATSGSGTMTVQINTKRN